MRSKKALLTQAEEVEMRVAQLARIFTTADTTIAGVPVHCRVSTKVRSGETLSAPAATSDGVITFNTDLLPDVMTTDGLIAVNGLNYHELAHVMYSPVQNQFLGQVRMSDLHMAYNVLEDQRIETLLVRKYPSVAAYLVSTIASYFLDVKPQRHKEAWPFLYGRKYLPRDMRQFFSDAAYQGGHYERSDLARLEVIVSRYSALNPMIPDHGVELFDLVTEFDSIMRGTAPAQPFHGPHIKTVSATGGSHQGPPVSERAKAVQAEIDAANGDTDNAGNNGGQDGAENGPDTPVDGSGGNGGSSDTGDRSNGRQDGDTGQDGGDDADARPGGKGASKNGAGSQPTADDAQQVLDRAIASVSQSTTVMSDINRQRQALRKGARFSATLPVTAYPDVLVPEDNKRDARKFATQLRRLVAKSDPGYQTRRSSGKVSMKRYMAGDPLDTVFDRRLPGKRDADSIEAVILVDRSSSMDGVEMTEATRSMWVIKHGLESLGNGVMVNVLGYDSNTSYLYPPGKKASATTLPLVKATASTDPTPALKEAMRIFANTERKRMLLFVVTDGSWGHYPAEPNALIRRMNAYGVHTALAFISLDPSSVKTRIEVEAQVHHVKPEDLELENYRHHAQIVRYMNKATEIAELGKDVVKAVLATSID